MNIEEALRYLESESKDERAVARVVIEKNAVEMLQHQASIISQLTEERDIIKTSKDALQRYVNECRKDRDEWRSKANRAGEKVSQQSAEIERQSQVIKEAGEIISTIPKGGSKEGRPDYVSMVTSDKVARLRSLLTTIQGDGNNA